MKNDQPSHAPKSGDVPARMIRETTEQWDDLPPGAKVVGQRRTNPASKPGYGIQELANELSSGRLRWPKGVFRFKTHEEADAWWTETLTIKKL